MQEMGVRFSLGVLPPPPPRWWFSGIITACHTPWHRIPFTREFTEHADRSRPGFDSRPTHFPPPPSPLLSLSTITIIRSVGVNGNILHCLCSAGGSTPSPGDSHSTHIPHIPIYDLMVLMATRGVLIAQLAVRFCLGSLQPHPHTHTHTHTHPPTGQ